MAPRRAVAGSLGYREWGDADAPALVFWPGLQAPAHAMLDAAAPALVELGYRVLAISPPGWETPALAPERYQPSSLAPLVVELLDAKGIRRAVYVGYSWGATIGCHLAVHAPERLDALVLLDAGYTDAQDRPDFVEEDLASVTANLTAQVRELRWTSWDECFDFFRPRMREWRPDLEERLRSGFRFDGGVLVPLVAPEVIAAAAYGVAAEPPSTTLERLGRLEVPILLVVASDTVGTEHGRRALERFRAVVPAAEVVEVDSSHDVLADAPGETVAAIARSLVGTSPRDTSEA